MEQFCNKLIEFAAVFAPRLLGAAIVLVIGFWIIAKLTRLADRAMLRADFDADLRPFLKSMLNVGMKVMLLFSAAGIIGMETSSFVAVLAAASFAVGMALQGSLSNFAGGVLILLFKPFRKDDKIAAQQFEGTVKEIQIFNTVLLTDDNRTIIIPNGILSNGTIVNFTREPLRRVEAFYSVALNMDVDKCVKLLNTVGNSCPYRITNMDAAADIVAIRQGLVEFRLMVWVSSADYNAAKSFLFENTKRLFDQEKIDFAPMH